MVVDGLIEDPDEAEDEDEDENEETIQSPLICSVKFY